MLDISQSKVLIADDEQSNRTLLGNILKSEGYNIIYAENGLEALEIVESELPDIILLDIMMPQLDGLELAEKLKKDIIFKKIPIIILTALSDSETKIKGLTIGAEDFLTKPFNAKEVLLRIRNLLRLKKMNDLLENNNYLLKYTNPLTTLPNKKALEQNIETMSTENDNSIMLLGIKLIEGKEITIAYGETSFLTIVVNISKRLRRIATDCNLELYHAGGAVFFLLLKNLDEQKLDEVVSAIKDTFKNPMHLIDREFFPTLQLGYAAFNSENESPLNLIKSCETAMSNSQQPFQINYYSQLNSDEIEKKLKLKFALKSAIENGEITHHFQPITDSNTNTIIGAEALMRWEHNNIFIPPCDFIPILEKMDLKNKYHHATLKAVQDFIMRLNPNHTLSYISINVMPEVFLADNFLDSITPIADSLKEKQVQLGVEITEGSIVTNPDKTIKLLHTLKELNIKTLIDDFGTGYSSFAYLKDLPISILKIDKAFVDDLPSKPSAIAVVESIITLAKNLNIDIVSEGVENKEQIAMLNKMGCVHFQGYYYHKPMPAEDLLNKL